MFNKAIRRFIIRRRDADGQCAHSALLAQPDGEQNITHYAIHGKQLPGQMYLIEEKISGAGSRRSVGHQQTRGFLKPPRKPVSFPAIGGQSTTNVDCPIHWSI